MEGERKGLIGIEVIEQSLDFAGCSVYSRRDVANVDAPWLVFSNSLMTDHTIWDRQVAHFGGRYNILRYDQRGHGRSDAPTSVSFDELSDDVLALLEDFEIERCVYVGLSMGVPTGLALAGKAPDRLAGMVLVDGQAATQPSGRQTWQGRIDFARANGMAAVAEDTVQRWFAKEFVSSGGADALRDTASAMRLEGYCACATALQGYDFSAEARAVAAPVLLLAGANDGAMPVSMRALAETIDDSRFLEIANAGHIPNLEQPEQFNAALDHFLQTFDLKTS
ncbi:alpha/beta fold hydrolase [Oryzicola mucosus]|uniref:Alpha/beta fold hydrolase n=1 Tax=Oryzicola mucosus TaxID=2767425 RepID=A0A8J6U555_9HYPH|nr:alpha/beta fold hydrolase [Oryzicola mucosus]MBD0415615.1 alpha/beta fold hydrolase [Oryzicola mucosus]